jgi:hypothetical protein
VYNLLEKITAKKGGGYPLYATKKGRSEKKETERRGDENTCISLLRVLCSNTDAVQYCIPLCTTYTSRGDEKLERERAFVLDNNAGLVDCTLCL